jgi:hypothetical protein
MTGSGQGISNGAFGLATIPAGLLTGTGSVPVTPPQEITLITVSDLTGGPVSNAAGSFHPGGAMGNDGIARFFFSGGGPPGSVPLVYVGGGGTGTARIGNLPVTVRGAVWTHLGASAGDPTRTLMITKTAGGIPITVTVTAFDQRTVSGQGSVQLVAPAIVDLFGGVVGHWPLIGVLRLEYGFEVPEPSLLLLWGSGVVALVGLGRARSRAH